MYKNCTCYKKHLIKEFNILYAIVIIVYRPLFYIHFRLLVVWIYSFGDLYNYFNKIRELEF